MGNILETLAFSDASKRTENTDPKSKLRRKMADAIDIQIAGANAAIAGEHYYTTVEKWVENMETGTKERMKMEKVFRRMWFRDSADRVMLELRFANKSVAINNKPSIVVGTMEKLVSTLQTVKKAVLAGELDAALRAVSDSRRRTLKLKTANTANTASPAPKLVK